MALRTSNKCPEPFSFRATCLRTTWRWKREIMTSTLFVSQNRNSWFSSQTQKKASEKNLANGTRNGLHRATTNERRSLATGRRRTNRWTGAAVARFASSLVRRRLNDLAPPAQLNRSALDSLFGGCVMLNHNDALSGGCGVVVVTGAGGAGCGRAI